MLALVVLLALTATAFATGNLGSGSGSEPPDGVTTQYYEASGDLEITITLPEPTNVYLIATRTTAR